MDLLAIMRKLWRYKYVTVPIMLLVVVGMAYTILFQPKVYEADESYILNPPPSPPTDTQIARDPTLANVRSSNPLSRYADQTVVVDLLSRAVDNDQVRPQLVRQGADPRYAVQPSVKFGFAVPIVSITSSGPSPEVALKTLQLVDDAVRAKLVSLQPNVDQGYLFTPQLVDKSNGARLKTSSLLRSVVGVAGLGVIVLFGAISVLDAFAAKRRESAEDRERDGERDRAAQSVASRTPRADSYPDPYGDRARAPAPAGGPRYVSDRDDHDEDARDSNGHRADERNGSDHLGAADGWDENDDYDGPDWPSPRRAGSRMSYADAQPGRNGHSASGSSSNGHGGARAERDDPPTDHYGSAYSRSYDAADGYDDGDPPSRSSGGGW